MGLTIQMMHTDLSEIEDKLRVYEANLGIRMASSVTIPCAYALAASGRAFWNGLDWSRLSRTLGAPIFLSDRPSTRYM